MGKKPSQDLSLLIKSLTKSEVVDFKIFAKRRQRKEGNNYILLFDEINKMETFDETRLKEILKKQMEVNQLTSCKNYLYNLILDFCALNSAKSRQSLKIELSKIEFLFAKGLYPQALALIHKAREEAKKQDSPALGLELCRIERAILSIIYCDKEYSKRLMEVVIIEKYFTTEISNRILFSNLLDQAKGLLLLKSPEKEKETTQLKGKINILRQDFEENLSSPASRAIYYQLMAYLHRLEGDIEGYVKHLGKAITVFQSNISQLDEPLNFLSYSDSLLQHSLILIHLGEFEKVEENNEALSDIKNKNPGSSDLVQERELLLDLYKSIQLGNSDYGDKAIGILKQGLSDNKFKGISNCTLRFSAGYFCYCFGQNKHAIEWFKGLIDEKLNDENRKVIGHAYIFFLICHYEQGNLEFLLESGIPKYGSRLLEIPTENKWVIEEFLKNLKNASQPDLPGSGGKKASTSFADDSSDSLGARFQDYFFI